VAPFPPPTAPTVWSRLKAGVRRHPVLCLMFLTPGIPEYLSGSSSPVGLVASPPGFALFLALNVGMYTGGVLLIREAKVRWRLGWASVLALGLAYGIAEEGLALTTLFDPNNSQVSPSTAGAWGGVNWGWSSGILPFHAVFSVAVPLFLLDQALPEIRGRSILTDRELVPTAVAYLATIGALGFAFASHIYWMGTPVLLGALVAIAGLVLLARRLPPDLLRLPDRRPTAGPRALFLGGATIFPILLLGPGLASTVHPPIPLLVLVAPALWTVYAAILLPHLGRVDGEAARIALAAGIVSPLVVSGEFVGLVKGAVGLPLVVLVDALALLFLWRLYQGAAHPSAPVRLAPPAGALA